MTIGDAQDEAATPRAFPEGSGRKPREHGMGASSVTAGSASSEPEAETLLMELVVSRANMTRALARVVGNKGEQYGATRARHRHGNADGSFVYTPNADANGSDTFTVVVSDGNGGTAEQVVNVNIAPVNYAPVAVDDTGHATQQHTTLTITAASLLANDFDVEGDILSIVSVQNASNGLVSLAGDGSVAFTPTSGYVGVAHFSYTVSDGAGGLSDATVSIDVTPSTAGTIFGTPGADVVSGTTDDDVVDGLAGNDAIYGLDGDDVLIGGPGADRLVGGAGSDSADYSTSSAGVSVTLGFGWFFSFGRGLGGDAQGDTLVGIENLTGSGFNDTLTGNFGRNVLMGGAGDDILYGVAGGDILDGGAGNDQLIGGVFARDTFVFQTGYGQDTIYGFEDLGGWQGAYTAQDAVQIDVEGVNTIGDLISHASQVGSDVRFDFGNGDALIVKNTTLSSFGADDFIFA